MRGMPKLNRSACEAITELIFVQDNPVQADFTIVLGMSLWRNPLEAAIRLFHAGKAGRLVFTGGYNGQIGRPEADAMAEEAVARGIPAQMVMCENRARNTRENVELSWNMIKAQQTPVSAVNIIAIHYHAPRAVRTARAALPDTVRLGHASYPSAYFSPVDWHACERGRQDVFSELAKLHAYHPEAVPAGLRGLLS